MNEIKIVIATLAAWILAQIIKTIIVSARAKLFTWKTFFLPGNMPSGHAAATVSLATAIFQSEGFTTVFILSGTLAILTMYDAITSRAEIGKQGKIINFLIKKDFQKITLKEITGHTPLQVLFGAVIGIIIATWVMHL